MDTKYGEAYEGHLLSCDKHMNLHLVDGVKKTTKKGESTRMNEARIKGVSIAGIKMSPQVLEDYAREWEMTKKMQSGMYFAYLCLEQQSSSQFKTPSAYTGGVHKAGLTVEREFDKKLQLSEVQTLRSRSPEPTMVPTSKINL